VDAVHPSSSVVGRRCPVDARLAARLVDGLAAPPRLVPVERAPAADDRPDAGWPWTATWSGTGVLQGGRGSRWRRHRRVLVEVLPWSARECEIQVRVTGRGRRRLSPWWFDAASALATDLARLVPIRLEVVGRPGRPRHRLLSDDR
jgi:hypothetical protein